MNLLRVLSFVSRHPLNKPDRMRALGRFFRWQVASRLLGHPVAVPFVDHIRLLIERGMTGATGNYYCGLHEAEDMAFVLHFMREGDRFYDIGANVGSYSLLAAAAGVREIIAFEPSADTRSKFARNVRLNDLQSIVSIHEVALGEYAGDTAFTKGLDTTNHVVAQGEPADDCEMVQMGRLDDFYFPGAPSFIKMDVEGFESQVLAGGPRALADPGLMGLLVEDNGSAYRYSSDNTVSRLLLDLGFSVFRFNAQSRTLSPAGTGSSTGNLLFLRNEEMARLRVQSARSFQLINGRI